MSTTRIVNEEYFTKRDSYYRSTNWLEPVYEETIEQTSDGEKITRKYLKYCQDNGQFRFSKGDVATYKRKGKWVICFHSFDDQPALISVGGSMFWFRDGYEHRSLSCGPQVISSNGVLVWDDQDVPGSRNIEYPGNYEHECHAINKPKHFFGLVNKLPKCCQTAYR